MKEKTVVVVLDEETHRKFKTYSVANGTTMRNLISAYIKELVSEKKERRIIKR